MRIVLSFPALLLASLLSVSVSAHAAPLDAPLSVDVDAILADLSGARVDYSFLDPGDRGHAYVFTGAVDLAILGSGRNNARSELRGFGATGDKRNGGSGNPFVDDGDHGNKIDLAIDAAGALSDDLAALLDGLGSTYLSHATISEGRYLAFNVLGARGDKPIDTVVFTGDYYAPLYRGGASESVAPVPLPAALPLLLAGLGGLLLATRRRRTS